MSAGATPSSRGGNNGTAGQASGAGQSQGPGQGQGQGQGPQQEQTQRDMSIPVPVHFDGHNINIITEFTNSSLPKPKDRLSLYKTELCREWTMHQWCFYGKRCSFAHGVNELRPVFRSKKWRTKKCRNWSTTGWCNYAHRCQFLHGDAPPRRDERGPRGNQEGGYEMGSPHRSDSGETFTPTEGRDEATQRFAGEAGFPRSRSAIARLTAMPDAPPKARNMNEQDTKEDMYEAGAMPPGARGGNAGRKARGHQVSQQLMQQRNGVRRRSPHDVVAAAAAAAAGQRVKPGLYAKGYDTGFAEGFKMAAQQVQMAQNQRNQQMLANPGAATTPPLAIGMPGMAGQVATKQAGSASAPRIQIPSAGEALASTALTQMAGAAGRKGQTSEQKPSNGMAGANKTQGQAQSQQQQQQQQQATLLQQQQQALFNQQLRAIQYGAMNSVGMSEPGMPAQTPAAIAAGGPTASPPASLAGAFNYGYLGGVSLGGLGIQQQPGLPGVAGMSAMAGLVARTPSVPLCPPSVGTDVSTPSGSEYNIGELNDAGAYLASLGINPLSHRELEFAHLHVQQQRAQEQQQQQQRLLQSMATPTAPGFGGQERNAFGNAFTSAELNLPMALTPSVPLDDGSSASVGASAAGATFLGYPTGGAGANFIIPTLPTPSPPPNFAGFGMLDSAALNAALNAPPTPNPISALLSGLSDGSTLGSQVNLPAAGTPVAAMAGGVAAEQSAIAAQINGRAVIASMLPALQNCGLDLTGLLSSVGNQSTGSNKLGVQGNTAMVFQTVSSDSQNRSVGSRTPEPVSAPPCGIKDQLARLGLGKTASQAEQVTEAGATKKPEAPTATATAPSVNPVVPNSISSSSSISANQDEMKVQPFTQAVQKQ